MGAPFRKTFRLAVDANPYVIALGFPNRSFLHRVCVAQIGGTGTFTVALYSRDPRTPLYNTKLVHLITTPISVTGGTGSLFDGNGLPFVNEDDSPPTPGGHYQLWAEVTGLANGTVDVTIGCRLPSPGG